MINFDKLLYRILLGYYYINVNNITYKVVYPDLKIKYEAEILYESILEENKFDKRLLTVKEIELYLLSNNIWAPEYDKKIKDIENQIEDAKVDIYLNFLNITKKNFLTKNVHSLNKILGQLYDKKHSFNHLSIEEYALSVKNEFMISKTIYDKNNNLVINYDDDLNYMTLQNFIQEIINNLVSSDSVRQLAKSNVWKSYAATSKIDKDILDINDDYKLLISFNNMYNNVRQHPECPSEDIINDDYALDGWSIHHNRKAEKEKKKTSVLDKVGGKSKDKGEHVFIFSNNKEEIESINDLNDPEQKRFKEEVAKYSESNPGTKWEDLPPVKRQIQIEAQKMAEQNMRRK
jgi:hypothetical protein